MKFWSTLTRLILLLATAWTGTVRAQVVVQYSTNTTAATTLASNTTATAVSINTGSITGNCSAAPNYSLRTSSNAFNHATATNYIQFTLKPAAGYQFTVTSINLKPRRTGAGPDRGRIDYNANGSGFVSGTDFTVTDQGTCPPWANSFAVAPASLVVNDPTNGLVVRVYFWRVSTSGAGNLDFTALTVNGVVSATSGAPSVSTPTAVSITESSAVLGATIVSDGGAAITARGTVYGLAPGVGMSDNPLAEGGTALGAFSHTRSPLSPQTQYFYKGYASNSSGDGLSSESNFFTFSNAPTAAASGLTATPASSSSANLAWTDGAFPASGATQYGYVVLRSSTGTPSLVAAPNGIAPASAVAAGTTLVGTVASVAPALPATTTTATGLTPGVTYTFSVMPFTWDGTNAGTYNYLTAGAPTAMATTTPTIYTWSGGDGSWADAANWSPNGVPGSGDGVEFNVTGTAIVSNVPTAALSRLRVNTGDVSLQATAAATLSINGSTAPQFQVAAGATLQLAGANAITVAISASNSGAVAGHVVAKQGAHRLTANDANSLIFSSAGAFSVGQTGTTGFSGAPFGSTGTANTVIFQNGATFTQHEGSNPFQLAQPSSKVQFQSGSNFHFRLGGTTSPSVSGRTYGNLFIENTTAAGTTAANSFTVENLTVEAGSSFTLTGSGSNANNLKGNLVADGNLTLTAGSGGNVFSSGTTHTVSGAASISLNNITIPAGATVVLQQNVANSAACAVSGTLDFGTAALTGAGSFTTAATAVLKIGSENGLGAAGNLQTTGSKAFSPSTTFVYNGDSPQVTGAFLPAIVGTLDIQNATTLSAAVAVRTLLNLDAILATDSLAVAMDTSATVVRTSGHVNGTLVKPILPGSNVAATFEIGDTAIYAPASVLFDVVTEAGAIAASTTAGDHPDIASSVFDAAQSVNRFWTISNAATGFDQCHLTLNWAASDVDAGVNTANLFGGKTDTSVWIYPATSGQMATSATLHGVTSFSDFQLAQCAGTAETFYFDGDGDGFGGASTMHCVAPEGYISTGGDCDDENAGAYPGAPEICDNGTDDNCDGISDLNPYTHALSNFNCTSGKVTITISGVSGGIAPYKYSRNGGTTYQTSPIFTNVSPGTYTLVVKDASGCTLAQTAVVNSLMALSASVTKPLCYGQANGSAIGSVASGGYPGYTFQWLSGTTVLSNTESVSGLAAGTYIFRATDNVGCSKSLNVAVAQPALLKTTLAKTNPSCFGAANGSIANTPVGGTPAYTFAWSDGSTNQNFMGAAGAYTVTITDANGCAATATATLLNPPLLVASVTVKHPKCFASADGTATAKATGGTGTKTYLWSTGANTAAIANLPGGAYTVTISDANGCQASATATLVAPAELLITNIASAPSGANFTVTVTATGGTAPLKHTRITSGGTVFNGSSAGVFMNVPAGTYTFKVTDKNLCTTQQSASIPGSLKPSLGARGAAQTVENQSFELVPNPASGSTQVVFSGEFPASGQLEIRDAAGRLLSKTALTDLPNGQRLSLAGLPSGVLFVTFRAATGTAPVTKRLVKYD